MDISEKLDIFLITYNRAKKLDKTLSQILAIDSPIKDFTITVIDNNSTDDTSLIVQKYQKTNPNLLYEKNKYNIGGNGNIARTFEKATKEYIWILCDDDNYFWDGWNEVETAILNKEEAIVISDIDFPQLNNAQLFAQTSFLPGVIYKTSNVDDDVIIGMQYNISNMFPHMVLSAKLFNDEKQFKIISNPIVIYGGDEGPVEETYTRGVKNYHPLMFQLSYTAAYANTLWFIKNKKLRAELSHRKFYYPKFNSAEVFYDNCKNKFQNSCYNLFCIYNVLDFWSKIKFVLNFICFYTLYKIIYIYTKEDYDKINNIIVKRLRIRLFSKLKTNIYTYKYKSTEVTQ